MEKNQKLEVEITKTDKIERCHTNALDAKKYMTIIPRN